MSSLEEQVVELLEEGWARWKIADKLGLGESTVRQVIKRMCERYQCSQRDLPDEFYKENNRANQDQDDEEEPPRDPEAGT